MKKMGSKGAVPEQIPVNFIIILAIFAMGAAVLLLMIGKWLDITGIKYKFETQRNAMSLSQLIVSNSPVVKRDPVNVPVKLVLDADRLTEHQNNAIGPEIITSGSIRDTWEKCCDFLDFDYNFTVHDLVTGENWTIGNLIFDQNSDCYPQRFMGYSDLPVVIYEDGRNDAGVAELKMIRTPLSELSYWLSQGFIRASWDKYWDVYSKETQYSVKIPLDAEIKCVKFVDINGDGNFCYKSYGRVCVILKNGVETCKNFICEIPDEVTFKRDWNHVFTGGCFDVSILVEKGDTNSVSIYYPGVC